MSTSKTFKNVKTSEIGYDTSRDSIDKKDLSFEDSPKISYSNVKELNLNEKLKCSFRKPLKKLNILDSTKDNVTACSWKNLYSSLFKYVIGKKTSLKEIENRIISVTEDIEYTTDLKTKKEMDNLELKERQNFVPSLINKYNVLIHKKGHNSPEKKPQLQESVNKTNIFKKFLNKNLKNKSMYTKRHPDNNSMSSVKFSKKVENSPDPKLSQGLIEKLEKSNKADTLDLKNSSLGVGTDKTDKSGEKKSINNIQSNSLYKNNNNSQCSSDIISSKPVTNVRKMSALDLKNTDDYQIPSDEVVKNQTKMPFKKYTGLLSDSKFIKHIISKAVSIEDLENIKHDIRTYESVLNSMTYLFDVPEMMEFEPFINFERMKEGLKPVKILRKFYDKEKIETMSYNVDEIINKFDAK